MLKHFKIFLLFIIAIVVSVTAIAQVPTDLYVFQLHKAKNYDYHIYNPKFLSGFNPGGYTNQPYFTPNGDILVSVRMVGDKQNDIFQLSPNGKLIRRLTNTTSNEYSPRLDPSNKYLSVLRQVEGDSINQQVFYTLLSGGGYKSLTPDRRDIGYYTWLDRNQLALFRIEGESNSLERYSIPDQKSRKITSEIGRSLWSDATGSVVYVHKFSTDYWYLKKYNATDFSMEIIMQTPGMTEDFVLAPDGTYFIAFQSKLFCYHPTYHTDWQEVADLAVFGIETATRLAVSPDGQQLAIVATKSN